MRKSFEQPRGETRVPKGQVLGGLAIGIIVIDAWYPMLPGNVANAGTFRFPVAYNLLRGVKIPQILAGDAGLKGLITEQKLGSQMLRKAMGCTILCGTYACRVDPETTFADMRYLILCSSPQPAGLHRLALWRPGRFPVRLRHSASAPSPHAHLGLFWLSIRCKRRARKGDVCTTAGEVVPLHP